MNILFLDSIECETYGGMEEWIRLVAGGLAGRGHTTLVAGRTGSEFLRRVGSHGITTLPLAISGDFNPITIARVRQTLVEANIDLICVNFTKDIRLGGLAARWSGATKVVWSVGLDITKDSLAHRWFTPKLVDAVLVPSESLKRQITALEYVKPELVTVIPIGIEDRSNVAAINLRSVYQLPADAIVSVTVGRFVEQKGHATLIDALPLIMEKVQNALCLFLGNGPLEASLRSRATALGIADHIAFGGMVDDVAPLIAGADLMIHPAVEEPFGIAVLEGMRAGLPIVASQVGGIPEVVGADGGARLVEPRNPIALAGAVIDMLENREEMRRAGAKNRQRFLEHFSLVQMIDRVEATFHSIAQAEPQHG
ncbi:MAG: glycosyltransferase family 4 protein [candidate division Zixibacteria bacterium]|nr:glycosyltransferase family 4 protein [candidate division Zixibacteria bacterium]